MDFEKEFPLRFWINLGRREDRRVETEARLEEAGVVAERWAAIDAGWKRSKVGKSKVKSLGPGAGRTRNGLEQDAPATEVRGYESAGRYALALTQRLSLREARRRGAPAMLLLEDDVVFHPNFRELIAAVDLPDDWGIFYLGCAHALRPEWVGTRVVRVRRGIDMHAVAIRAPYYRRVMEMLDRNGKPHLGVAKASDQYLALLHEEIPAYAAYPNLAWQDVSDSDLLDKKYSNYTSDGRQRNWVGAVAGLLGEAVCKNPESRIQSPERGEDEDVGTRPAVLEGVKLGLLFLTRGDVNHPEIWREFVAEAPGRVRVFSHRKDRNSRMTGELKSALRLPTEAGAPFLEGTEIREYFETEWGGLSLVRASRAMLLEALEDESLTHFALLSEACVPVRPLPEILRRLEIDPRSQFAPKTLKEAYSREASRVDAVPEVPADCWRFTSQWWLMDRAAGMFAAGADYTPLFEQMTIPDEAYFATVLQMQAYPLEGELVKKNVTWTWWEKDAGSPNSWPVLPLERLEDLLHSGALFARKFPPGADIGKYGLHRSVGPERGG